MGSEKDPLSVFGAFWLSEIEPRQKCLGALFINEHDAIEWADRQGGGAFVERWLVNDQRIG